MELQCFVLHVFQPLLLFAIVQLVYFISEYLTVGVYVLVIVAVVLAVMFVLHLSHENAEQDAIEAHEEQMHEQFESQRYRNARHGHRDEEEGSASASPDGSGSGFDPTRRRYV